MRRISTLGFQFFLLRWGFKEFFDGFYYFKWLEYPLAYNQFVFTKGRYLDIGSGKSCFPLAVLLKTKSTVYIIDDQSIIKDSLQYYRDVLVKMKLGHLLDTRLFLHGIHTGGASFDFPDDFFDNISCISVLEHIMDDGDSLMMNTIERVLKKGGRAVVTFPFNNGDYLEGDNQKGVGYFQRIYNITAIKNRIVGKSNLKVRRVIYFGERYIHFGKAYLEGAFKKINWLIPLFSSLLWRVCHAYDGPFRDYHEKEIDKEGVGVACIVFEKE